MKYKLLCLFVLLSFSLSDLYADIELSSKQMRTSDGLPSNSVRCMFQDSKGFLCLGTLDGLTRSDGNTFLTYQLESGKHDQISLADKKRSDGSSELYSVTDFVTKTTDNIRKGYLVVKYGATPNIEIEEVE